MRYLMAITLVISVSIILGAQDYENQLIYALTWVPYGEYSDIEHFNYSKYRKVMNIDPNIIAFIEPNSPLNRQILSYLPNTIKCNIENIVMLNKYDYKREKNIETVLEARSKMISTDYKCSNMSIGVNGERYYFLMIQNGLAVCICKIEMESALTELVRSGNLIEYERHKKKYLITKLSEKERRDIYLYYKESEMVLTVAHDVNILKGMIETGHGREMSILDNENYIDLFDSGLDDSAFVFWDFHSTEAALNLLLNDDEYNNDEDLREAIEKRKKYGSDCLYSIRAVLIDDEVKHWWYLKYSNSEIAEENKDWFRESRANASYSGEYPEKRIEYNKAEVEAWKWELDGDVQTGTLVFDEKLSKLRLECYSAIIEHNKKREKM